MKKYLLTILILLFSLTIFSQANLEKVSLGVLIKFKYYEVLFNKDYNQASFATYMLTSNMLEKNVKRKDNYYNDLKGITPYSDKDYKGSGFDRGHLVPVNDMLFNDTAMLETFNYANITFQYPSFNRGIWKELENKVRSQCTRFDTVYVITGPMFNKDLDNYNKKIPDSFFKVILVKNKDLYECAGFIIPNLKNKKDYKPLSNYIYPVDDVEFKTGLDFFSNLNDDIEDKIESKINYLFWFYIE